MSGTCGECGRRLPGAAPAPRPGTQRWMVLELLAACWDATAPELADALLLPYPQTAARLRELRYGGYALTVLDASGNVVKRQGKVHKVTPAGERLLNSGQER